jgi:nucleotide-binding universal stress UspA family protein
LFNSGRPVIVVPEAASVASAPRRVLIAWRASPEATRAVHEAMPILLRAEQVRLLVVDDGHLRNEDGQDPGADIARHLARHSVNVEVKVVPAGGRSTSDVILSEARYLGAELIVMGGYGHSRLREWIFGGATRDILHESAIPMFIAH